MEEFQTYPKIHQLGKDETKAIFSDPNDIIYIQEKIDGANFRFMFHEGKILYGSRTNELGGGMEEGKSWKRCVNFIKEAVEKRQNVLGTDAFRPAYDRYIFYGECCTRHSIHYNFDEMPPFLGFDIYDLKNMVFLNQDLVEQIYKELGLQTVPLLPPLQAFEIVEVGVSDKFVPNSKYYPGQAEGIMFKNYSKQIFAKYVTDKFKEVNKDVFGGNKNHCDTHTDKVAAQYCTNARIDKWVFKLVDEGNVLDMPIMKFLPNKVYDDMLEENWKEITSHKHKYVIDFGQLKNIVNHRCLSVLKQLITNQALQ